MSYKNGGLLFLTKKNVRAEKQALLCIFRYVQLTKSRARNFSELR